MACVLWTKNSVYCFSCKLFAQPTKNSLVAKDGFNDWNHLPERLKEHENSQHHRETMMQWFNFEKRLKNKEKSFWLWGEWWVHWRCRRVIQNWILFSDNWHYSSFLKKAIWTVHKPHRQVWVFAQCRWFEENEQRETNGSLYEITVQPPGSGQKFKWFESITL